MLLEDLQGLTTEEKFRKAAEFAGVPAEVLDRQWATESARGKALVGPETKWGRAKGHFQFLDSTAATFEGRLGVKYNYKDFDTGLLFAAHQWKENMARYGDVATAAAAYHGGTNKANWGAMTKDYVSKLTGAPLAEKAPEAVAGFESLPAGPDKTAMAEAAFARSMYEAEAYSMEPDRAASAKVQDKMAADTARAATVGLTDVLRTSWNSQDDMATRWLLDAVMRPAEEAPAGWSYSTVAATVEKDRNEDERDELREEGRSPAAVQRVLALQDQRRKENAVYQDAGTFNTVLGRLAVGVVDPASVAAGFGIGKALHIAKVGHAALTAAGKGKAAVGMLVAENVAGNVAIEAAMDAAGKVSSAEDYMFAVGSAAALTAPFTRGVYRKAADNATLKAAEDLQTRAVIEDPKSQTVEERTIAVEEQARTIRDTVTTKNEDADKAVPEHLRRVVEEEAGEVVEPLPEPVKVKKAKKKKKAEGDKPAEPEPMTDAEVTKWLDDQNKASLVDGWKATDLWKPLEALMTDPRFNFDKLSVENQNAVSELWQTVEAKKAEGSVHAGANPDPALSLTTDGKPLIVSNGYFGGNRTFANVKREVELKKKNGLPVSKYDEYLLHALDPKNVLHVSDSRKVLEWLAAKGKQKSALGKPVTGLDKQLGAMAEVLLKLIPDTGLDNTPITFSRHKSMPASDLKDRGAAWSTSEQIFVPVTEGGKATLDDTMRLMVQHGRHTALHEIVHGITSTLLNHVEDVVKGVKDIGNLNPKIVEAYKGLEDVRLRLRATMTPEQLKATHGRSYATLNLKEFVAQLLSDPDTAGALIAMPASKGWGGKFSTAFHEAVGMVKQLLGFEPHPTGNTAYDEAVYHLEQLLVRRDVPINGPHSTNPAWPGNAAPPQALPSEYLDAGLTMPDVPSAGPRNPQAVAITRRKFAADMYDHARDFMTRNPINMEKLKVFTAKFGAASDGLVLAASKNPICQMVATLITETTTGAAGRKVTAALRRESLFRQLMGNSLIDYDGAYSVWAAKNGGGFTNDILNGEARRKFDKAVYTEVLNRRTNGGVMSNGVDPSVGRAVMALEASFERALKAQKTSNTLGSKRLPTNSVGYIPQALDGQKLAVATEGQIKALTDHLASHWVQSGFTKDRKWAKEFSIFYVDRARARAMGQKGVDVTAQSSSPSDVIRDTLKAMRDVTRDPDTLSAITKAEAGLATTGLGQTKRKLDVDLMAQLPGGQQVMDFYETDVAGLLRRYMNRTAGTVALTEFGIHGAIGARHMRDSIMATSNNPNELASRKELEAFDRVMSEMLGTPVEGAVNSQVATNLRMLTSIQRLGGTVYNQFAETFQLANHLGLSSLLGGVKSLPRMMGEVGRLKKGGAAGNHILTSIETVGGEIGMDNFKLVMPLDAPDIAQRAYGKDQGLIARLLSAGQHAQSKVTFFRGLMAAQHRATAEQITLRALRFAKESRPGEAHVNLTDMGFDPDLIDHIRNNLGRIARYDASGNVVSLDITQLPNPKAAEEFVAAVHRGTMQIIQGTFIGERSAWMHNDWMKLMLQMRTFGLTAVEKQWGRTRMNHGYARATGLLLGSMAMALPVHLARVHAASIGRDDREEFVKKNLSPYAMLRATMNYASLTGVAGDLLDVTAGIGGGWSDEVAETVGAQAGTQGAVSVSRLVPSIGSLDAAGRVVGGKADLYTALKQLPGSNIPFIVPIINLTK